jgi:hypothetical protein
MSRHVRAGLVRHWLGCMGLLLASKTNGTERPMQRRAGTVPWCALWECHTRVYNTTAACFYNPRATRAQD